MPLMVWNVGLDNHGFHRRIMQKRPRVNDGQALRGEFFRTSSSSSQTAAKR